MMNLFQGLSDAEVAESRRLHGYNIIRQKGRNSWTILTEVLKEPMLIVLSVTCSIYFILGEGREGIIMLLAILVVAGISIFQQIRSEKAVKALRKLTQELTFVIRNGNKIYIPSEELVIDDIIIVSEGQHISADAIILESNDMAVDESILTGESFPVEKNILNKELFSGTTVTSGLAHARVTAIGNNTKLGKLGISMEEILKEKTPLQKQINIFVKRLALFGFIAFLFVWLFNYIQSGNIIDGLLRGLTLAMAALPEEIPVALSTFMALGAYHLIKNHVVAKQPQTVEALGAATVICVDKTGTITENKMSVSEVYDYKSGRTISLNDKVLDDSIKHLLTIAMLASEPLPFDPMEKAIHEAFNSLNLSRDNYKMIKEYPLSGKNPFMTHVYINEKDERVISCKGAPEGIIQNAGLNTDEQAQIMKQVKLSASKGNRVLAVAIGKDLTKDLPDEQSSFQWNLLGLIALSDPPKKNIPSVIKSFYDAGIEVKMITGDFPETACSIARQVNIKNPEQFITGQEIEKMNDETLRDSVSKINIFARVMPEIKLRIINALKANGEVVAMTGDGVNDGPALKAAHIGIAMGNRGSEVARQAASLVLVNDDLSSMVVAVAFGRKIYFNLKKAIQYIISIHIPLISIVTLPLILGWKYPNIFTPIHVIFLELVMGPTCSIAFENEPMEINAMNEKPRKMSHNLFTWKELSTSVLQGLGITLGLMLLFYYSIKSSMTETDSRTMVFTTIIFSNILLTLTGRSKSQSIFRTIRNKNYLVPLIIIITLSILVLSLYYPPVQSIFAFNNLSVQKLLICFSVALISVLWIELYKLKGNKTLLNYEISNR